MTNLYSLLSEHQFTIEKMLECVNEDGEILDDDSLCRLEIIKENALIKQKNIAAYVLNLESDCEQMKGYVAAMNDRKKEAQRKIDRLKELLKASMVILEQDQVPCDEFTIKLKDNPGKVVINNEGLIPDEFMRTKTVKEPDKTKIGDALKKETVSEDGEIIPGHVPGCHFEKGKRVEIK